MDVETVKVYKGKSVVLINKTDLEEWNKNGYKTSAQQKSSKSADKKQGEDKQ